MKMARAIEKRDNQSWLVILKRLLGEFVGNDGIHPSHELGCEVEGFLVFFRYPATFDILSSEMIL
jgi:hypothetical protein